MKIDIVYVQNILSSQDYLAFDKVLNEMYESQEKNISIEVFKETELIKTLRTFEDIEEFKKRMFQIYGIFAYV